MRTSGPARGAVESLGGVVLGFISMLGAAGLLLKESAAFCVGDLWRRTQLPARVFWTQAVRSGPRSLLVVCSVGFFVGLILALIGGRVLIQVGFREYIGKLMGLGMVLELGPLLTAIIMTGYIGAAFTAEIATMVVGEEISAMETMGVRPLRIVVAPRIVAVALMVPCVTLLADGLGLLGGLLVADGVLGIGGNAYWDHVWLELTSQHIWRGVIKAAVFGLIIGVVGCIKGLRARGGAEGVGRATTSAVVTCIMAIIVSDAILNYIMLFRT